MGEGQKEGQELCFRNVELHRTGRKLCGTLHLTQHHLCFSYSPSGQKAERSADRAASVQSGGASVHSAQNAFAGSATSSSLTDASESVPSGGEMHGTGAATKRSGSATGGMLTNGDMVKDQVEDERRHQRPKEIWVPYPLVNHCILRPSHAVGHSVRQLESQFQTSTAQEDD